MYGLFGGAAGRAAGRMATALDGGKGGYSQDPKIRQRAGLMDPMREDEEERRRRGLFGRIGDMFSQDALSQTNAAGVTRGEQLGAMLMSLAGPQQQAQAMNMLGNARARGDEERRLAEAQREEREQAKLEGVQANEERARQIQQIYALEEQFGLERGSLAWLPEEARDGVIAELSARRFTPDAPEAPATRTVQIGGETVTQQWNPSTRQFEEIGRAPRWQPQAQSSNRAIREDANGRARYVDSGELVFPDVEVAPEAPEVSTQEASRARVLGEAQGAVQAYRDVLREVGVQRFYDPADPRIARLEAARTAALMQAKELFNLGVLSGPDLEIIEGAISDVTGRGAMRNSTEAALEQLTVLDDYIARGFNQLPESLRPSASAPSSLRDLTDEELERIANGG